MDFMEALFELAKVSQELGDIENGLYDEEFERKGKLLAEEAMESIDFSDFDQMLDGFLDRYCG